MRDDLCRRGSASDAQRGSRPALSGGLAAVFLVALLAAWAGPALAASPRPNIVVVTTDDQDVASLDSRTMPNLLRLMRGGGTSFSNAIASGPLCCPSRAVLLTGQYGHNNGVLWNEPGYADLREKGNTLPVWLGRAGYRTAHVGRYLNGFGSAVHDTNAAAPGWDEWHTVLDPTSYFNYYLRSNGHSTHYGRADDKYLTRVLNATAVGLVDRYAPSRQPLFMVVDHLAPHRSGVTDRRCGTFPTPDPRDRDAFLDEPLPRTGSFDEADVTDKPSFVAGRPPLGPGVQAALEREHGCRLASLRAVDRGVAAIESALRRAGELDDTMFVFTSDNGWLAGQHRVPGAKVLPYEESLRVPLLARLPDRLRGPDGAPRTSAATVGNIDLVPTLVDLAGARPCATERRCRTMDGRSLLGLLRGQSPAWSRTRALLLELEAPLRRSSPFTPCDYEGLRTGARVYLEHHSATGPRGGPCRPRLETELYNLRADPFQLQNRSALGTAAPTSPEEQRLAARLRRLRNCAGIAGRDPRPESGQSCE